MDRYSGTFYNHVKTKNCHNVTGEIGKSIGDWISTVSLTQTHRTHTHWTVWCEWVLAECCCWIIYCKQLYDEMICSLIFEIKICDATQKTCLDSNTRKCALNKIKTHRRFVFGQKREHNRNDRARESQSQSQSNRMCSSVSIRWKKG